MATPGPGASPGIGRITAVAAFRLRQPLEAPYHLAFGTLNAFDSILAHVRLADGREGWGETTACTGYVPETGDEIWQFVQSHGPRLLNRDTRAARRLLAQSIAACPFSVTPLLTAIEQAVSPLRLDPPAVVRRVPLVGIVSADDPAEIERAFWTQREQGHTTIKAKAGFGDPERDVARLRLVQDLARQAPSGTRIRVDANQGCTLDEARRLVHTLTPDVVELFEQPFPADDWDAQVALAPESPVPLMLDESIHGPTDVERAAALGCAQYVKFKLMKAGSVRLLREQIALAHGLGLGVVLGNGVAGEVGCSQEALVAVAEGVETAGEMNGFLKLRRPLLARPLTALRGALTLDPSGDVTPDVASLEALAVSRAAWS